MKQQFPAVLLKAGSQDGDLPLVIDVFKDDNFWRQTVGCEKPLIQGLGSEKMLTVIKK